MLKSALAVGVAVLAFATPALAQEAAPDLEPGLSAPEIEFTEWTLDNGLRVIAIPDEGTATVTTSLWYEVGSKHDPEGRSGFAHLFEHILSRKTENMPYNMIYGLTADVGGTRNASTGSDRTNYYETVPAEYLETMLWTHRERMFKPVIDQQVFDSEREVVKEELRQRVLAPPYGRLQRFVIAENAYDVLPQRRPGIGSIEELDSATLDDARAFHQAYYGPDTATLIVAGNFEMANLRALVDEYFADIPRRADPVDLTISAREPERTSPRSFVATAPNVPLPVAGSIWKAPGSGSADSAALDVLTAIMARGQSSRLYDALVRTGKAVDSAMFYGESEEGGYVASFAITNPMADADEVDGLLKDELERIRTEPVSAAELAEAKSELFSDSLQRRETARGRAFELGEALVSTGNPRAADDRLAAIAAVSAEDVQRAAAKWLAPDARVDMRYVAGEENPSAYANPVPMPTFRSLPSATGEPLAVLPEGERQEPPAAGTRPEVVAPDIMERTLANGIEVVAAQTGEVPLVTMTVLVPGGASTDTRDKAGVAQFAAQLADQGTADMSAQDIAARLESLGASFSANAGRDGTFFSLTAPAANIEAAGGLLASIVRTAQYPQAELDRERKRAIDGLLVEMKDPGALAGKVATLVMYGDAPYGSQPGGTAESLAAITREDLLQHRRTWWHPGETKIIVSGGLDPAQATSLAEALFGDWSADGPAPTPPSDPAGEAQPVRTVVIDMPEAGQAAVYAAVRAMPRDDERYYALELSNAVLGGGSSGRLFEEIRTKRSLSYGAYSGFADRSDDSVLTASAQTKNETADEVAQIFLDEFARLGTEPLDEALLDKRRLYLGGNYARSLESSSGFNGIVAGLLQQGLEPAEAARYAERLAAVTPESASAAAQEFVDPEQATLVIVGNAAEFIDGVRAIRPDVEVIPAEDLDLSAADFGLQE
ncbi:M16 family metallopeptidase [Alteriqipengyuania lutimaris]|uniref:Insulinase family protein n=1 Tax=Alteriqipengyuania lutimaris TaxID=1538146 RepID=A0A395LLW2_9SPHN|nr:pitrilysin family protein [Alteriqipengyuania lutimaris]MBB3033627.1 zinc protease [Alteriqipengyuania lutimaris]RDS77377.1 insulinase family protein [Alteriqipengyuania lutimaris]